MEIDRNDRRQAIADMVNQLREVSLTQLKQAFPNVSEVTLRSDLRFLDENHQVIRIHGGAKSLDAISGARTNFQVRSDLHLEEKKLIARKAATLIRPGDSIFLAAGSTCVEAARCLPQYPLFLFTQGIGTLLSIPHYPEFSVEMLGGSFDYNTMRVLGPSVPKQIENLNFNLALLGTPSFHPDYGFGCLTPYEVESVTSLRAHCKKMVFLMDSSKINYSISPRTIPFQWVDMVVTDDHLPPSVRELFVQKGVEVL